jgi:ATP-dependent Clp protease ATP-binding subunit ClpA
VIAKSGYDPVFGARPLRRAIQHLVEDRLAEKILAQEFPEGARIVVDGGQGDELSFTLAKQDPVEALESSEAH